MDIQLNTNKKNVKRSKPTSTTPSNNNKDLLRLQKPIYQLKKSQENEAEYVIRKLMTKKQKPNIEMIGRSPLLSKLEGFMPTFKKSNEEIQSRVIAETQKIDANLQECSSSSQSEDQEENNENEQQTGQNLPTIENILNQKLNKMQIQPHNFHAQSQDMQDQSQNSLGQQLQLNFLTYPYLTQEQLDQLQAQKLGQKIQKPKQQKKKVLIEQIDQQ